MIHLLPCFTIATPIYAYGHADHPELHSFPTRRSSDLLSACQSPPPEKFDERTSDRNRRHAPASLGPGSLPLFVVRSEEHTSELQSLRHLVCRLLLEKKKYIKK